MEKKKKIVYTSRGDNLIEPLRIRNLFLKAIKYEKHQIIKHAINTW